jgi:ABC-type phosphate transport system substrate-binding protein
LEGLVFRGDFEKKVLNKSASQIKAYWSKLVFTGKGTPPKEVSSDAEVINLIKSNPNLIGYVDESSVTGDVKVIATF